MCTKGCICTHFILFLSFSNSSKMEDEELSEESGVRGHVLLNSPLS